MELCKKYSQNINDCSTHLYLKTSVHELSCWGGADEQIPID